MRINMIHILFIIFPLHIVLQNSNLAPAQSIRGCTKLNMF